MSKNCREGRVTLLEAFGLLSLVRIATGTLESFTPMFAVLFIYRTTIGFLIVVIAYRALQDRRSRS